MTTNTHSPSRRVRKVLPCLRAVLAAGTVALLGVSATAQASAEPEAPPADVSHQQVALTAAAQPNLATVPAPSGGLLRSTGDVGTTEAMLEGPVLTAQSDLDTEVVVVGVSWRGTDPGAVRLRAQTDGQWSDWAGLEVQRAEEIMGTEGDVVLGADKVQVQVQGPRAEVMLDVWGSDPVAADLDAEQQTRVDGSSVGSPDAITPETTSSTVNGPIINTRQQWGADESVRKWSPNYIEETKGITLHHTAGVNDYTAAQVPSILRGIYQYHAVTLDWGDVGYNMLVDKYGRAWEGRRGGVNTSLRNAQALGMNYTTAGISILGDYDRVEVPRAGFEAMAAVTAWKLDAHNLSVNSTFRHTNTYEGWTRTLPTVNMHRDVNQTVCPGRYFAARIDEFRSRVSTYQSRRMDAVQRIAGANRYETAADLAEASHPWGAETVFLAEGRATADVLSIGPAADRADGAVLLTQPTALPAATRERLEALHPKHIVMVGGTARIKDSLIYDLRAEGYQVSRVAGPTRYDTAAQIAKSWPDSSTLYVSSGTSPATTLPAGAAAAHVGAPMLLVDGSSLSTSAREEIARLNPSRVVVVGSQGYVSTAVAQEVRGILPDALMRRIAGQDPYDTSIKLALDAWPTSGSAVLVNGGSVVDGVAGTQLAAYQKAPLVLTRYSCQTSSVRQGLAALSTDLHTVLGGSAVIDLRAGTNGC